MKKYGDKIIFFQKFVYGIKTLIPIAIGLTKYSSLKFNILNVVSAAIWAIMLGNLSFYFGKSLTHFAGYFSTYPWLAPVVLISLVGLLWYYFKIATRKR